MTQKLIRRAALTGFAGLFALAAVPVLAQQSPTPGAPSAPSSQAPANAGSSPSTSEQRTSPADLGGQSVQKLMGKNVVNADGKKVGDIEDFVVENTAGADGKQITYAVIGVGGFLGLGEKHVAIPMSELQVSSERIQLSSNMSQDQIKQMPNYDRSRYRSIVRNTSGDSGTTTRTPAGSTPPGGGSAR